MEIKSKPIVLVHPPGDELFPGVLHPDAALFADYIDVRKAASEHRAFRKMLAQCGFEVITVGELLLRGTLDDKCAPVGGDELDELRAFAASMLEFDSDDPDDRRKQELYKDEIISRAHPYDLLKVILNNPCITLRPTADNTGLAADYHLRPMMNLFYMRDQMVSTPAGVTVGRLRSPQRAGEAAVAAFCLHRLGIEPAHTMQGDDFLEGGDFVQWGDVSYICSGMRTNDSAVARMLSMKLFGTPRVVVVRDRFRWQAQMHLDTYFNVADDDLVLLSENRLNAEPDSPCYLAADVYDLSGDKYVQVRQEMPFVDYLKAENITIIPVSDHDSKTFGANFLSIAPRDIIAVSHKSSSYRSALRRNGIKTRWIDLTHCIKGYGAAHCLTQVIDPR